MRIIFLDVDGPLIPGSVPMLDRYRWGEPDAKGWRWSVGYRFDPGAVQAISDLARATGAQIVFNSGHCRRGRTALLDDAHAAGFAPDLIHADATTELNTSLRFLFLTRGGAVRRWLRRHPEVTSWCVIDDDYLLTRRQVRVRSRRGLTDADVAAAKAILTEI